MAPGGIKAWNRSQYPGAPHCGRAQNNTACPISVSIEQCHVEGLGPSAPCSSPCPGPPGGAPAAADCRLFDCAEANFSDPTIADGEMFGITFSGIRTDGQGAAGSFRVADTTIANTPCAAHPDSLRCQRRRVFGSAESAVHRRLSGLLLSEKAADGALFIISNVTLLNTAVNLTSYANWIWRAKGNKGWLNSPVIIQNDSPATYGSAVSCTASL